MKRALILFSILLNIVFALLLARQIPMESGGGAYDDMAGMHASASSLADHNPLRAHGTFYRFSLEDQKTGATLAQIEYRDAGSRDEMAMRTYPKVVNWDAAGTEVRFVTPEVEILVKRPR